MLESIIPDGWILPHKRHNTDIFILLELSINKGLKPPYFAGIPLN